eukprot:TRINITY_DN1917_c0_g1_i2.p1 TRINITY_DN1917_c0_g1~~TRINITY_DN1917_c0_g1_i2.p1  ORF type:complete len:341 (-),score=30.87 TRINITY_DN1917_c0_g1_i2:200-1180(-)
MSPSIPSPPNRSRARRVFPDSFEMRFWHRVIGPFFCAGSFISVWFAMAAVAPYTNTTILSLMYQDYLNHLVHRVFWTDFFHHVFSPIITTLLFATFNAWSAPAVTAWIGLTNARGDEVLLVAWIMWYMTWALVGEGCDRLPFLGVLMAIINIGFFHVGRFYVASVAPQLPNHWAFHPFALCIFVSWLQAMSHGLETLLPPRACGVDRWVNLRDWARGAPVYRTWKMFLESLSGTVSELIVTPKLNALHTLFYLNALTGYGGQHYEILHRVLEEATADGDNAAIDYMGTGGSAQPHQAEDDFVAMPFGILTRIPVCSTDAAAAPALA